MGQTSEQGGTSEEDMEAGNRSIHVDAEGGDCEVVEESSGSQSRREPDNPSPRLSAGNPEPPAPRTPPEWPSAVTNPRAEDFQTFRRLRTLLGFIFPEDGEQPGEMRVRGLLCAGCAASGGIAAGRQVYKGKGDMATYDDQGTARMQVGGNRRSMMTRVKNKYRKGTLFTSCKSN